ncbi:hypothetical protein BFU36_07360 [Sulfolobus sp. A20]|uniref:MaoC family dehydratase n=1 Tax=Saccharolobus sp. A20 TaxID=1891280 RepID=UPI000845DBDA|nr:MaoC family dehydratase [Sulfolobus sp. A20]TRM74094.1 dehydratase [Sulfolobus sp. A20-N-F8]TRM75049.1 dehydratase [Sulfolobus sp. E5]TRM77006.1 dehydratase [Sulfolobus sp. B5]TRM80684.1 dehydratase [Sulfolobus sp. D5]TRM83060.1 dehydratase [Sulfolobus sp. A20-N-F6]TRM85521.1 dehydratase [Sulfolobus sp. F3]TRM87798.1 dehydratase [Sulfolobus sp. C3]TRM93772.1 dehydratase [Sulfolobus sp. A20-N-G8]TRM99511.1 dehydratase [Sulfolobus sp. F1]TRN01108.1 dehydratase [Sulfolobus sp. E1]
MELKKGERIVTNARTITDADIVLFSGLTGDYHPAHTNEIYAKKDPLLGRRIAHGLLVLSISQGLFVRSNVFDWERDRIVLLGFNNIKFLLPVYPGDTIFSVFEVTEVRESKSRPGAKIVTLKCECKKHTGETACTYDYIFMLYKSEDGKEKRE